MAKKRIKLARGKHETDLALERAADELKEKKRLRNARRKELAAAEMAERTSTSPSSSTLAMDVDAGTKSSKVVARAEAMKRRSIRKANRKPNKIMQKMMKKAAKKRLMETG